jgi:TonB family protein
MVREVRDQPAGTRRRYLDEDPDETPLVIRRSRSLMPVLFWVMLAIASAAVYELWRVERGGQGPKVHTEAQEPAREIELHWDPSAPAVLQATRGVLAVTDGRNPMEIGLDRDELRGGSLSYSASHPDVVFQLRLYDQEGRVSSGSLRVIRLPNAPTQAQAGTRTVPANPSPASAPAVPLKIPSDAVTAEVPPRVQDSQSRAKSESGAAASPLEARHEVQPVIPAGIRNRISGRTVVPVVVHVDESGRVTQASSKVKGHGVERYLADEAVKAARQWSFTPARAKSGAPVAATKTISFEFTPVGQ